MGPSSRKLLGLLLFIFGTTNFILIVTEDYRLMLMELGLMDYVVAWLLLTFIAPISAGIHLLTSEIDQVPS